MESQFVFLLKFRKTISRIIFGTLLIHIFTIANTPATCILCLVVFQIWCSVCTKNVPNWLSLIFILLSNDIHLNPGPQYQNNFFNFMSWNVNSIAKDDFQRVRLIEAHNSIFNYDLFSICETSLNDSVELPETLLNGLHVCVLPIIQQILGMAGWVFFIKILSQLLSEMTCLSTNQL